MTIAEIAPEVRTAVAAELKKTVQSLNSNGAEIRTIRKAKDNPYTVVFTRDQLVGIIVRFRERNGIRTTGRKMCDLYSSNNQMERALHNLYVLWQDWKAGEEFMKIYL